MHRKWIAASALLLIASSLLRPALAVEADRFSFQSKIEEMLEVRAAAYTFAERNGVLKASPPPFTREQSNELRRIGLRYLEARKALLTHAEEVSTLFEQGAPTLTIATPTRIQPSANYGPKDAIDRPRNFINPLDEEGRLQLLRVMRGLAAAMVLWDSYSIAVLPYERSDALRYVMTYDVDSASSLRVLANNYYSPDLRTQLLDATRFVDGYMSWKRREQSLSDEEENELYGLTQSTQWYVQIREKDSIRAGETFKYVGDDLNLHRKALQNALSYGLSMGFGNIVGLVQTRKGLLSDMGPEELAQLSAQLRPLDILLEKTPFRLTDKLIPGHYGHVAIWLGSEEDLKALGIWDRIAPTHQRKIRAGGRIVEALRSGVTINSLPHFLNVDDFLVLRRAGTVEDDYRRQAALTTLEQVGKEYDFNFDVYTHERIVCSELAYVVFPEIEWPLAHALGRYTISPDNVARVAIDQGARFEPVVMYRDGKHIEGDLRVALRELVSADEASRMLALGENKAKPAGGLAKSK